MDELNAWHATSKIASIDDLLGDGRTRFFSDGFRHVRDALFDVHVDVGAQEATASARIEYPRSWSTKKVGELEAHLSTLDGLTLAAQMVEMYLRVAHGLGEDEISRAFLARIVLRSGSTPTLDLSAVPVIARCASTETVPGSVGGLHSSFAVQVGTMNVELVVDHASHGLRDANRRYDVAEALLGDRATTYYGGAYRLDRIGVREIEFNPYNDRARAKLDFEPGEGVGALHGMSAAYVPFVSPTQLVIGLAQVSQAMMYRYDGITREVSHNLWMRRVLMRFDPPVRAGRDLETEVWASKMNLLDIKGALWRVAVFGSKSPGVVTEHNLAHQLPDSIVEA